MSLEFFGAGCFGFVIGWICYRTLRLQKDAVALSDLTAVIAALTGGAIATLYKDPMLFAGYSIGLAIGFVAYYVIGLVLYGAPWWKGHYFQ